MTAPRGRAPSVLFVNRVYPSDRGATGRLLRDLAQAFAQNGWNVTILCAGSTNAIHSDGPVSVHRIGSWFSARRMFGGTWVLLRLIVSTLFMKRTDLIVTMTDPPFLVLAGYLAARIRRVRHVHWCQDLYPDLFPVLGYRIPEWIHSPADKIMRAVLQSCDRVVVIGRCMARRMTKGGLDPRKIAVLPNWPDFELVYAMPETMDAAPIRRKAPAATIRPWDRLIKDEERKFRVLYAGNIGRAHPFETILDAAEIVARKHPEIEFVFVGEGQGHEKLATARARRGLNNIRQLSWQPAHQLRAIMESGDVHLISMSHDAAGLMVPSKLFSALAVGRPCIFLGPSASEVARTLLDNRAGAVVPQGNPVLLADTVIRYRLSSNDWFLAQEGAARAMQNLMPEDILRGWIDMAAEVVMPAPRPKSRAPETKRAA
ncbi:MAG: glycosyltransferase family 4 protein [Rhodospirillales bacterium]|nr:glycosyltransferase family 4 protein [Rhodospirillales bacterium]